jgi:hypothetical protein
MANCPTCGSSHIHLKRETNVSWGRAAAGWALFGVVGGAVGAVTGDDKNVNACLDCGTSWKAADLYKTLQIIKNTTGETLDLTREKDRLFMNSFIHEISPYLESISDIEKRTEKLIKNNQGKLNEKAAAGCSYGCLTSVMGCTAVASTASGNALLLTLLLPPLIGVGIGSLLDAANKKSLEKNIRKTEREGKRLRDEAEIELKLNIAKFMEKYR